MQLLKIFWVQILQWKTLVGGCRYTYHDLRTVLEKKAFKFFSDDGVDEQCWGQILIQGPT
jgi:hypothetical protein